MTQPDEGAQELFWQYAVRIEDGKKSSGELISLAEDRPDTELIPWEALREASLAAWSKNREAAAFGDAAGSRVLHALIAEAYRKATGEICGVEDLLLTSNAMAALDIVLRCELKPGEAVATQAPAAPEVLRLLRQHGAEIIQVQGDSEGMLPDALTAACAKFAPRLAVLSPDNGGPSGGSWSLSRREALLLATQSRGVTVVELSAPGIPWRESGAPSLFALRRQIAGSADGESGVIGIGSLEPHLPPLGWIRAAGARRGALLAAKAAVSPPGAALFGERVLEHLLAGSSPAGRLSPAAFETTLRRVYGERRQLVLSQLAGPSWYGTVPLVGDGDGRYVWAQLPEGYSSEALLRAALLEGAAFVPGPHTFITKQPEIDRLLRLNVTGYGREPLRLALDRIASALEAFAARS